MKLVVSSYDGVYRKLFLLSTKLEHNSGLSLQLTYYRISPPNPKADFQRAVFAVRRNFLCFPSKRERVGIHTQWKVSCISARTALSSKNYSI